MFEFIIKNKIKKFAKKKREPVYKGLEDLKSILVLFETSDYEYADYFIDRLLKQNKSVRGCGYRLKDTGFVYSKTSSYIIVPNLDTNKSGVPSSKLLDSLKGAPYDIIIDLTVNENDTLQYILGYIDAPLKIGLRKNELPFYDVIITTIPDNKEGSNASPESRLGEQIYFYLNAIRTGK